MKSDPLQGQSSLRNVWSATEYVFLDLTLFCRNAALFIDLNPAVGPTFPIDLSAQLSAILSRDFSVGALGYGSLCLRYN